MVSSKSFLAVGLLLLSSLPGNVSAAKINSVDENPSDQLGPIIKATYDTVTGNVDVIHAPVNQKRGPPPPVCPKDVKSLVTLLRQKREQDFCKNYVDIHPVVYKTVTVQTCGKNNPKCYPVTSTTTVKATLTRENTVTAATPIVTEAITPTESATISNTITITVTSTVGTPLITPAAVKRGRDIPPYLKNCPPGRLSSACSSLVEHYITTTTITKTKTITGTAPTTKVTVTKTVATQFRTKTVTPEPTTFTTTVAPTTITVTAPAVTKTTTICPSATTGISGISVSSPGRSEVAQAQNPVDCCTTCFNTPGCVGWAYLGGLCFYVVEAPPNSGTPTAQCPFGLGQYSLATGGLGAGGPGPCNA